MHDDRGEPVRGRRALVVVRVVWVVVVVAAVALNAVGRSAVAIGTIALGAAAAAYGLIVVRNVAGIRDAVIASSQRSQWSAPARARPVDVRSFWRADVGIARVA